MINAAGIMFLAPGRRVLFLKRSGEAGHDHAGEWCMPGGCAEYDENAEQTARREAKEEIGEHPNLKLRLHTRQIAAHPDVVPQPNVAAGVPLVAAAEAGVAPHPPSAAPADPTAAPPNSVVDFTTFVMEVERPFLVDELSDEHVAWAWAPIDAPPTPLHPGCQIALDRLAMDELGVARAMADGRLTSPQVYENVTLFDIRITGTETAYRKALDEFVYRRPENYLTPEFVARCNGLPVIMEHPKGAVLNSKEFADRIVGTVFVPYIGNGVNHSADEVWGVAKIYDVDAIKILSGKQMSTSPSVVFRYPEVNQKVDLEDGSSLLIEGKPSLLDHIAICEHGVWDKGGEPTGVAREPEMARGDSAMAEAGEKTALETEKKEGEKATDSSKKADAGAGEQLDRVLSCLDSMSKRMDSIEEMEKSRKDSAKKADDDDDCTTDDEEEDEEPKKLVADKKKDSKRKDGEMPEQFKKNKRKDSKKADEHVEKIAADDEDEEEEKDEKKADARTDSSMQRRLDELERMVKPRTDADEAALADAQTRADSAYMMMGGAAPRPLDGESVLAYRRRLLRPHQTKSGSWKEVDLARADSQVLEIAEKQIYADSIAASSSPSSVPEGQLIMRRKADETGRVHVTWGGQPRAWLSQFAPPTRRVVSVETRSRH
jgi:8-oxo-dGTP pyrophosphatase MutT (NUDIX family)